MKVLVVCQHFYPEEFRINDICYELVKKGHDVTVLTGLPNYPKGKVYKEYKLFRRRKENHKGVDIHRSFLIGRGNSMIRMIINYVCFALFGSLKALFIRKKFDVIYVYQLSPITMAWPAILLKKLTGKKMVIHCLDQWPISITIGGIKEESLLYKTIFKLSKWTYKQADLITISSKCFKKYFTDELKIKDKGLLYWPSYAESAYDNVHQLIDEHFDLVFAGNIGPAQSVDTIIETANILKDYARIKIHIVGDGLCKEECEILAKKYKLKNVIFHGFHSVEKMPYFYGLADAFLITMADNYIVNNTLPAKIQSYMLAGKPIIGAVNGEVKEVIKEANCGLCCNSLDFKELANIIIKIYKHQNKLKEWGVNARKYYDKHFDKDKCISDLEVLFNDIIEKEKI